MRPKILNLGDESANYIDKIIHDYSDISLYAKIQIGSQRETFDMMLDSGSSWVWVATDECRNCLNPHKLNWQKSESFKQANTDLV